MLGVYGRVSSVKLHPTLAVYVLEVYRRAKEYEITPIMDGFRD